VLGASGSTVVVDHNRPCVSGQFSDGFTHQLRCAAGFPLGVAVQHTHYQIRAADPFDLF
jgi:hypothetical protein